MLSARFLRSIQKIQKPEDTLRFLRKDKYWQPEVVAALLARIDILVSSKPKQALELAQIALDLVRRTRKRTPELEAHAFCSLATTQRWLGRLKEAESNYRNAERHAHGGSAALNAMILRQKALLFIDLSQLDTALKLATRAVALELAAGVFPSKSLNIEGIVRGFRQDTEGSLACFKRVLELGDPKSDDYLFATNNLVASLLQRPLLGTEIVEARKTLRGIQERIRGIRATPVRYCVWVVEGRLHAVMEEFYEAARHFSQARDGFRRLEMIPDYARVSADLVDVLVRKGDLDKARVVIQRTAKWISEYEDHERFATAFQLAMDQPLEKAADFIRSRLQVAETPTDEGDSQS